MTGHYPIYSAGQDGTTSLLVDDLLPLLAAHGAHYLSGHDHMWEHIIDEPTGTHMFLAGAGKECCYYASSILTVPRTYIQFMVSGLKGSGYSVGDVPNKGDIDGGFGG